MSNAPAQARRANGVRLSTETRSRRCLQPVCSAILFSFKPQVNLVFCFFAARPVNSDDLQKRIERLGKVSL
jgi:hypothetical protein